MSKGRRWILMAILYIDNNLSGVESGDSKIQQ